MNSKKELKAALMAARTARDIIETFFADSNFNFSDAEIREIFYELNTICIRLSEMYDAEEALK